jgi:hypothetical protein
VEWSLYEWRMQRRNREAMPAETGEDADKERTLFYVVDWLPPDFGAVGQYAAKFARDIAAEGRLVVLCGLTSGSGQTTTEQLSTGGVLEIHKLSANKYNKSGLVLRLLWSIRANVRLIAHVIRDPRSKRAEVLFTGAPPFMLFFVFFAKWMRHSSLTYRITDFYPEVILAALNSRPLPLVLFERITWLLRRRVDVFQVLGEDQRKILVKGGIEPKRIQLKRDVPPINITCADTPRRAPVNISGYKILLYSGNYGVAHDQKTLIQGFVEHHRSGGGEFALWLNASGSAVHEVAAALDEANVPYTRSVPVPLSELPSLLLAADVHLISLRPQFAGYVLPSKVYACIQSRRPILFLGPKGSDVHLLCSQEPELIYEQVEAGDVTGFAEALARLALRSPR